ncbi:unnamed protein product [Pleuronectes platessa]|uniref:Uncharacterized protein n=1 Tax=Pleuronectes platessa TaxID=8262 RepID=A0A9N7TNX7_PLEPL|nr:unnamed protein product [Pleuronectes platessa]
MTLGLRVLSSSSQIPKPPRPDGRAQSTCGGGGARRMPGGRPQLGLSTEVQIRKVPPKLPLLTPPLPRSSKLSKVVLVDSRADPGSAVKTQLRVSAVRIPTSKSSLGVRAEPQCLCWTRQLLTQVGNKPHNTDTEKYQHCNDFTSRTSGAFLLGLLHLLLAESPARTRTRTLQRS